MPDVGDEVLSEAQDVLVFPVKADIAVEVELELLRCGHAFPAPLPVERLDFLIIKLPLPDAYLDNKNELCPEIPVDRRDAQPTGIGYALHGDGLNDLFREDSEPRLQHFLSLCRHLRGVFFRVSHRSTP